MNGLSLSVAARLHLRPVGHSALLSQSRNALGCFRSTSTKPPSPLCYVYRAITYRTFLLQMSHKGTSWQRPLTWQNPSLHVGRRTISSPPEKAEPRPSNGVETLQPTVSSTSSSEPDPSVSETPLEPPPDSTITTTPPPRTLITHLIHPFTLFSAAQRRRPYWTQFWISLVIYCLADLIAQHFQTIPDEPYSPARTIRMMIIGGVASTPSYWWFSFLGRHFNYSSLPLSLLVKVIVQQSLFAPTFNTYFFAMQAALEGKGPPEVLERIGNTLPDSLLNSVKLWPAVTALNFWLVEARFRMLVAALVAVGWQGYLSYLNSREKRRIEIEHKDQEKQAERSGKTKRKRAAGVVKKRDGKAAARNAIAA